MAMAIAMGPRVRKEQQSDTVQELQNGLARVGAALKGTGFEKVPDKIANAMRGLPEAERKVTADGSEEEVAQFGRRIAAIKHYIERIIKVAGEGKKGEGEIGAMSTGASIIISGNVQGIESVCETMRRDADKLAKPDKAASAFPGFGQAADVGKQKKSKDPRGDLVAKLKNFVGKDSFEASFGKGDTNRVSDALSVLDDERARALDRILFNPGGRFAGQSDKAVSPSIKLEMVNTLRILVRDLSEYEGFAFERNVQMAFDYVRQQNSSVGSDYWKPSGQCWIEQMKIVAAIKAGTASREKDKVAIRKA